MTYRRHSNTPSWGTSLKKTKKWKRKKTEKRKKKKKDINKNKN